MLVYLLYWYKSTNTDAECIRTTSYTRVANASSAGGAHVTLAGNTSTEATEAEAAVKPPPLTDDEFLAKLEQVKQAKSAAEHVQSAAASQNSAAPLDSTGGGAQEAEPVEPAVSGAPAGAVATATATASLPGSSASGGGTGGDSGEVGGGMKFCKEMYGVNSEYNAGDGQCRCREGFKEDSFGMCVAVERVAVERVAVESVAVESERAVGAPGAKV